MNLFLIRHFESEKNINNNFSSFKDDELLTPLGCQDTFKLALTLESFIKKNNLKVKNIYSANSLRAIRSCEYFAHYINANIKIYDDLVSSKNEVLAGISEEMAKNIYPDYMHQYELYRKGLFNVYNFTNICGRENKKQYERKVINCLNQILSVPNECSKFVFLHRSAMTAILIYFARNYYQYPQDFYGYIPIDLGHIYGLKKIDDKWKFIFLNCPYGDLRGKCINEIM